MSEVELPARWTAGRPFGLDPAVFGAGCCVFAALGYTAVNICLRVLTVRQDPMWILLVKEAVATAVVGPWFVYQARRGRPVLANARTLAALAAVGLLTHLGGNLPLIWAMSVIGLAITVPATLGVNLVACAALGRLFLREPVTVQSGLAIAAMIASVILLSLGAGQVNQSITASASPPIAPIWIGLAVVLACFAGVAYGILNLAIRRSATRGISLGLLAFLIPAMGVVGVGPVCLGKHGLARLLATPPADFLLMLLCGALNLVAYLAMLKGLQLTSIIRANVLGASQVAMAALAGLVFFGEAASPSLVAGVCLTVAGMILLDRPAGA
ncbi:MAG: EamA family transporter [Thermoguttaceae bacterium]